MSNSWLSFFCFYWYIWSTTKLINRVNVWTVDYVQEWPRVANGLGQYAGSVAWSLTTSRRLAPGSPRWGQPGSLTALVVDCLSTVYFSFSILPLRTTISSVSLASAFSASMSEAEVWVEVVLVAASCLFLFNTLSTMRKTSSKPLGSGHPAGSGYPLRWHPPPLWDLVAMWMQAAGPCFAHWGFWFGSSFSTRVGQMASPSLSTHLCGLCPSVTLIKGSPGRRTDFWPTPPTSSTIYALYTGHVYIVQTPLPWSGWSSLWCWPIVSCGRGNARLSVQTSTLRRKRKKTFGEGKFVEEKEKKEHIIETEKLLRVDGTGLKGSLRNIWNRK